MWGTRGINPEPNIVSYLCQWSYKGFFSIIYHTFCRWYQCFHGKNIANLVTVMNNESLKLSEWMNVNKLSLNVKKTEYMLFCMNNPRLEGGSISLNGEIIDKVNQFKFLCVIIDSHLSWMDHVQHIRKKISKGIGILYKKRLSQVWYLVNFILQLCVSISYILYRSLGSNY